MSHFILASSTITDWLIAIGTICVVIIALFRDVIISFRYKPKLEIILQAEPPDCHKIIMSRKQGNKVIDQWDCYYFRFRVKNTGNRKAESVEVVAMELSKKCADGNWVKDNNFTPLNLVWSNVRTTFLDVISPGMEKLCDIGHINDPNKVVISKNKNDEQENNKTIFWLDVNVEPNTMCHLIDPGEYRLTLNIGASNAKLIKTTLEINHTGKWHDDENAMLTEGIGIRIV